MIYSEVYPPKMFVCLWYFRTHRAKHLQPPHIFKAFPGSAMKCFQWSSFSIGSVWSVYFFAFKRHFNEQLKWKGGRSCVRNYRALSSENGVSIFSITPEMLTAGWNAAFASPRSFSFWAWQTEKIHIFVQIIRTNKYIQKRSKYF